MSKTFNGEEVLCSANCYKNIKTSTVIASFFTNMFSGGIAGMVTNNFRLVLTPKNLYIEAKTQAAWGGLPEILYTDKFGLEDIRTFEVINENSKELISITTSDGKKIDLIRNNDRNDNLASQIASAVVGKQQIKV